MRIGRYEVEAEVGRGAMGVVYLALDPRLQRRVAIKTYRVPDGMSDGQRREFQERFLREAQAAARLSHRGIVTVFDSDEDESTGDPFIAMEFIEGRTLRDLLDESSRLPAARAFDLAAGLAEALQSAHDAGIVHRDVKPGNVMVVDDGDEAKITDFGVARLSTSELTRTGMTLGSPAYMSPEHITSGEVDARSDLFSLAAILYEMLCGERPFGGDELASLAYSIVHEHPIPVTKRVPGLTRAVDEFFDRALAKNPIDRFSNGREFAEALRSARTARVVSDLEATLPEPVPVPVPVESSAVEPASVEPAPVASGAVEEAFTSSMALPCEEEDGSPPPGTYPADDFDAEHTSFDARKRRWLLAGILVVGLVLGGRWVWGMGTKLDLEVKSSVPTGNLTLQIDGRGVFEAELAAGGPKGVRLLKKAVGIKEEHFSETVSLSPGPHEIVALLELEDGESQHRETLKVEMERGVRRTLRVTAGGAYGAPLNLRMD